MKTSQVKKQKNSIKEGDMFLLGEHVLICGDSTSPTVLDKSKCHIDLMLTDPPYGVDYVNSKTSFKQFNDSHKSIENDHIQSEENYADFTKAWLAPALPKLSKPNSIYVFNSDKMIFALKNAFDDVGIKFSQLLIWVKNTSVIGRLDYQPQHELIAYGWLGKHQFKKSKDKSILFCPKPNKNKLHPTMKPISLLRRLMLNSTDIGQVVYDPFGGSGSTLIACEQTKRRCVMVEKSPEYCEVILKRFTAYSGVSPKPINHEYAY